MMDGTPGSTWRSSTVGKAARNFSTSGSPTRLAAVTVTCPAWNAIALTRAEGGLRLTGVDLALQLHQRVQQRVRSRRATGNVDVDRDDLIDALDDVVRVDVRTA